MTKDQQSIKNPKITEYKVFSRFKTIEVKKKINPRILATIRIVKKT